MLDGSTQLIFILYITFVLKCIGYPISSHGIRKDSVVGTQLIASYGATRNVPGVELSSDVPLGNLCAVDSHGRTTMNVSVCNWGDIKSDSTDSEFDELEAWRTFKADSSAAATGER